MGTHVSFVRSIKMDAWTDVQVEKMKQGGNQKCKDFLKSHGINMSLGANIKEKYDTPAAQLYQLVLKARVAGEPEPTELPQPKKRNSWKSSGANSGSSSPRPMAGFGSAPPPSPKKRFNLLKNRSRQQRMAVAGALSGAALVAWSVLKRPNHSNPVTHERD